MKRNTFKDLSGMRFGMLVVEKVDHIIEKKNKEGKHLSFVRYWRCRCDCGGSTVIRGSHITGIKGREKSITRSCGCERLKFQHGEKWRAKSVKPGTAFRRCLDQYKANAKNRGLLWDLTDEQFRHLTTSPCQYTGELPSTVQRAKSGEEYTRNGIDRVDNSKGYSVDNCVPCSPVINQMKADLPLGRFLELCKKVSERTTS